MDIFVRVHRVVPTNTFQAHTAIGNREDLSDIIYLISPVDTPFSGSIAETDATAVLHEWQTDALAAADANNQQTEGDDTTADATTPTVRLTNRTQILRKAPRVSGTQEEVNKAGRNSEMAYQVAKRAQELKRDLESSLIANKDKDAGSASTARQMAGYFSWVKTNFTGLGTGTAEPVTADGEVTADLTASSGAVSLENAEANVLDLLEDIWTEGGDPDCIMMNGTNKIRFSQFNGFAQRVKTADDRRLVATIDLYDSPFGELQIIPNRFFDATNTDEQAAGTIGSNAIMAFQKDMWAVAYLRNFRLEDLAKTGDSEHKHLIVEATLEARNQASSGTLAGLA